MITEVTSDLELIKQQYRIAVEQTEEEKELAEIAEVEAQLSSNPILDEFNVTPEQAEAQEEQARQLYERLQRLYSNAQDRYREANAITHDLRQMKDIKRRWRMYQVWRVLDDEGNCDYTPGRKEEYRIKEVGQVLRFKRNDRPSLCRNGTHGSRLARYAFNDFSGNRLARLELEGYLESSNFRPCTCKVLAIIDVADLLPAEPEQPAFVPDTKARSLRRWHEPALEGQDNPLYLHPSGGSTTRADGWREVYRRLVDNLAGKFEAFPDYVPTEDELGYLFFVAMQAETINTMFNHTLRGAVSHDDLLNYFEVCFEKMELRRKDALGIREKMSIQGRLNQMDNLALEKAARAAVMEKFPGTRLRDFGVKRGQDVLNPGSEWSPSYWRPSSGS